MKLETLGPQQAAGSTSAGGSSGAIQIIVRLLVAGIAIGAIFFVGMRLVAAFRDSQLGQDVYRTLTEEFSPGAIAQEFDSPELPLLSIRVSQPEANALEAKRVEAVALGLLIQDETDFVTGELTIAGQMLPVNLRLKGDGTDHLSPDKPSFRIQVRGEGNVFGMRRFSLQHPSTRKYLNEFGYFEHLRREGVLAPRYTFVELEFNGERRGIFALEEHFSKELLESQSRREGVIIRFDEERMIP